MPFSICLLLILTNPDLEDTCTGMSSTFFLVLWKDRWSEYAVSVPGAETGVLFSHIIDASVLCNRERKQSKRRIKGKLKERKRSQSERRNQNMLVLCTYRISIIYQITL